MATDARTSQPLGAIKELTIRGIILGAIITVVFTAANVYLGLKIGITFATSIPAAVISMYDALNSSFRASVQLRCSELLTSIFASLRGAEHRGNPALMDSLVYTNWLAEHLGEPDLRIVDATWFMPKSGRSGAEEFRNSHIPGAVFLDIDELSDRSNPAPHMVPLAAEFGSAMECLGVGRDDRIIVYDNSPVRTAARGWFMQMPNHRPR